MEMRVNIPVCLLFCAVSINQPIIAFQLKKNTKITEITVTSSLDKMMSEHQTKIAIHKSTLETSVELVQQ